MDIWQRGEVVRVASVADPRLASWDAKSHPSQVKLASYLSELIPRLGPLPDDSPLFLHFEIGIKDPAKVLCGCNLENYLYPLFGSKWLSPGRFVLVSAAKAVAVPNSVTLGLAIAAPIPAGWQGALIKAGAGSQATQWKQRICQHLAATCVPLPAGAVEVQIAFRCSSRRNWINLWKPAGDCLGPILGVTREAGFNPCDDRIVDLRLHKIIDDSLANDVCVEYWWRMAQGD